MARRGRGEGSIYQGADGWWHASLSRGTDPLTGKRLRVHVQGGTSAAVRKKLKALQEETADLPSRERITVAEWFDIWLGITERSLKPSTIAGYQSHSRYVKQSIGKVKLRALKTEHIESLYVQLRTRGLSGTSVAGVHRSVRASLNEAVRRGWIATNPALHARPGRSEEVEVEPLTTDEAKTVLAVARGQRNGARWAVALSLGLRQGEALGLCWDDVDFEARTLRVRRAVQRVSWKHGCESDPCGRPARACPHRYGGGLVTIEPKSRAGKRTLILPPSLVAAFREQRRRQAEERIRAGELWQEGPNGGWVFATEMGKPTDPAKDWKTWKAILRTAGVRDVRLHDARHSAATYLLVQGVDPRTVMGILGWSQVSLTARYQHVVPELKREAAERMEQLLWGSQGSSSGPSA